MKTLKISWWKTVFSSLAVLSVLAVLASSVVVIPSRAYAERASDAALTQYCQDNYKSIGDANSIRNEQQACKDGYNGGYDGKTLNETCNKYPHGNTPHIGDNRYSVCAGMHKQGADQRVKDGVKVTAPTGSTLDARAKDACTDEFGASGHRAEQCQAGYKKAYGSTPTTADKACTSGSSRDKSDCRRGFQLAQRDGAEIASPPPATADPSDPSSSSSSSEDDCDAQLDSPISWIICPVVDGMNKGIDKLDNAINDLMTVDTQQIFDDGTDSGTAYHKAWSSFRDIALGLVFISALLIIIATALGYEILDAYTIRKLLPRVLLAVIFIALSWSILDFLINLANDVGNGIRALIYAPFKESMNEFQFSGSGMTAILIGILTGLLFLGPIGFLSFGATALLAVLLAFFVLMLRELIIIFLVVFAPIGIACMILPGTRKGWQLWQNTLTSMLVAFPIISGMIAMGHAFSISTFNNEPDPNWLTQLISFAAYLLPYFLLPFAFRLAGGAIASLGGLANDRSRGAFDMLKQGRRNRAASNLDKLKKGERFNEDHIAAPLTRRFNNFSRGAANIGAAGYNPRRMRSRMQAALSTQEYDHAKEAMEKNASLRAVTGNDDYNNAVMHSMRTRGAVTDAGVREYLQGQNYTGRSLEQGVAQVREARRSMSAESFAIATTIANAGTGTGYARGEAEMLQAINTTAGNDRHLANRMLADSRGLAERANRVDLSGAGFGGASGRMERLHNNAVSAAVSNQEAAENVLHVKGAGAIVGARGNAIRNLAPQMLDELRTAYASGNEVTVQRTLAKIAGRYDEMGRNAPENAEILADAVMAQPITAGGPTVRQLVEANRNNEEFLNMRREYGRDPRMFPGGGEDPGAAGPEA